MGFRKQIKIFTPPEFTPLNFSISNLNELGQKQYRYASRGRYALLHILKSLPEVKSILLPAYACYSILKIVKNLNIRYYFYDIDIEDLNADFNSIKILSEKNEVSAILIASLYGNPADLSRIEQFCICKNIILIDDAAQSFGAILDGREIGTFGNAGFFSFSPGKPTAGHMGAFFWTEAGSYQIPYKQNYLIHKIIFLDFYFNRLNIYKYDKYLIFYILKSLNILINKIFDLSNDNISEFEIKLLGGILERNKNINASFRNNYFSEFFKLFSENKYFKIIKNKRGIPNIHKIVIKCNNKIIAKDLIAFCSKNYIYANNGYELLTNKYENLPSAKTINGCIVELPIENNYIKMQYLFEVFKRFIQ